MDLRTRVQDALAGQYRLERELGRGGMATVYLAEDLKHGRMVAVKVLLPELAHAVGPDRFLREIEVAARLSHPNILPLYDSGEASGLLFYVMPCVEGESLRDRLDREKQLPLDDALQITREVANGLSYAHSLGVVHRDIKPENILFQAGHAVLSDFGIARAVSSAGGDHLTETGTTVGTPAYMSPEQAAGEREIDQRSDVYSLACVLYEMIAGDTPYTGPTPQAILARKTLEPVPSLRVVRDTVPPGLEHAVTRGLAKRPADRFPTALAFAEALSGDAAAATGRARLAGVPVRWLVAAVVAVVALAGAAYGLLTRRSAARAPVVSETARLTAAPGVEWFPSLSADGQWLAYAGETAGNRDVYLLSVGGRNPINLTRDSPADDDQPVFSPDGERIAFRSSRDGGGIFVMGRTGEAVRRVTRFGFRPTWNPQGTELAFATENVDVNPQNFVSRSELWVVDVGSGELRQISLPDAVLPSWSPHGERIAFTGRGIYVKVWTVPAAGGEPLAVTTGAARDWSPVWSPDGRYLYFVSDRQGSMNLWRVRIDETSGRTLAEPEPITTPATALAHVSLSGDGRLVAYTSVSVTSNIQRVGFDPIRGTIRGEPVWLTTGSRRWGNPQPSPDGQQVVFYSLVEPEGHLYVMNADGTGLRQLTGDTAMDRMPSWSPDGQWISFYSDRSGRLQIWKLRPDGSELQPLLVIPEHDATMAVWSPDGSHMVASTLNPRGGAYEFDLRQSPTRPPARPLATPPDSLRPFGPYSWSPNGERVAGTIALLDSGVVSYTVRSGTYQRLTTFGQWPVWLPDSRRLLFVSGGSGYYVVDRETGRTSQVFSSGRDVIGPPALTRDGRELYYTRRVTEADIWLVTLR